MNPNYRRLEKPREDEHRRFPRADVTRLCYAVQALFDYFESGGHTTQMIVWVDAITGKAVGFWDIGPWPLN